MQYERFKVDWEAYHQRARTGRCFICAIIAQDPDFPAHVLYEDQHAVAFLARHPPVFGYSLVAPREHREQVTASFCLDEYLELQKVVHRVSEAVRDELGAERMYVMSWGSNQGNAHVHWHIVPLPPGIAYEEQQLEFLRQDALRIPDVDQTHLAARLRSRLTTANGAPSAESI